MLVATILSAQCTDERVNRVTKTLFDKYRKPQDYLRVPESELAADIGRLDRTEHLLKPGTPVPP